jgi:hypothetical protein
MSFHGRFNLIHCLRPGPGDCNIKSDITNNDDTDTATAVEVELYGPGQKIVKDKWEIPVSLAPGENTQIP